MPDKKPHIRLPGQAHEPQRPGATKRPYKQYRSVQAVLLRAIAKHGHGSPKRMVFPYLDVLSPCKAARAAARRCSGGQWW